MPRYRVLSNWDQTLDHLSAIDRDDIEPGGSEGHQPGSWAPSAPLRPSTAEFAVADTA